jgi:hypothetical protein
MLNLKIHGVAQGTRPVVCVLGLEGLFPYNSWLNSLILLTLLSICLKRFSPKWQESLTRLLQICLGPLLELEVSLLLA